jgi:hypothetical protein
VVGKGLAASASTHSKTTPSSDQRIDYCYTPTNFGNRRLWFECPNCCRACGVLYGGRRFYCRQCWRPTYASQYEDWWERARRQAEKIRTKLGQPGFIDIDRTHDFPDKPKWMRWHTYRRLRAKDSQLMRAYEDGFFHIAAEFFDDILAVYVDMIENDDLDGMFDLMRHAGIALRPDPTTAIGGYSAFLPAGAYKRCARRIAVPPVQCR